MGSLGGEVRVTVYLDPRASPEARGAVAASLREPEHGGGRGEPAGRAGAAGPGARSRRRVAARVCREDPLPPSLEVRVPERMRAPESLRALAAELRGTPAVTGVDYGEQAVERLSAIARAVRWAGWVAFVVLVGATLIIVSATLQLAIYARREEVEIQKLVGATDRFVQAPFLLEGALQGLAGAALAIAGLVAFRQTLSPQLATLLSFLRLPGVARRRAPVDGGPGARAGRGGAGAVGELPRRAPVPARMRPAAALLARRCSPRRAAAGRRARGGVGSARGPARAAPRACARSPATPRPPSASTPGWPGCRRRAARRSPPRCACSRSRLAAAEAEEALARAVLESRVERLRPRLLSLYRLTQRSPLEVLLPAEDVAALAWRARALSSLVRSDLAALDEMRSVVALPALAPRAARRLEAADGQPPRRSSGPRRRRPPAQQTELGEALQLLQAKARAAGIGARRARALAGAAAGGGLGAGGARAHWLRRAPGEAAAARAGARRGGLRAAGAPQVQHRHRAEGARHPRARRALR